MGNKVNLLEALRARIAESMGSGKPLNGKIKVLRVGPVEEARSMVDFPVVFITPRGGEEEFVAQPNQFRDNMDIDLILIDKKLPNTNTIYKTSDSTGIFFVFETLLNELDLATDDSIDLDFGETADDFARKTYSITYDNDFITITMPMAIRAKRFTAGGR